MKIKATLFISKDKREKIRRSGLSLEEYFKRLYEAHERFNMDRWTDGCFWIRQFRVCLLRSEMLNSMLDHIDKDTLRKFGVEIGEKARSCFEYGFELDPVNDISRRKILEVWNDLSGWGDFTMENGRIIIKMPIFTKPLFLQGYLEGALNLKLTLIDSHPDRITLKVNS